MAEYYANLPPDEDRGRSLLALFYTSWILANLVLAARAFVRIRTHSIGLDDWSMFGAWVRTAKVCTRLRPLIHTKVSLDWAYGSDDPICSTGWIPAYLLFH